MRNLIGLTAVVSMMLVPGCATTAQAGASVSVSVGFGGSYSTCYDDDVNWDNVIVLDNSRVGFWLMLPSGRWVFRVRSMWWNSEFDDWAFGPWYDDYNITYRCHCHDHFNSYCPFHAVRFHVYMHEHYRPWHDRHFNNRNGLYVRRFKSHDDYLAHYRHNPRVISRHDEPAYVREVRPERHGESKTIIIRQHNEPVRNDGGTRPERIERTNPRLTDNHVRHERFENNNAPGRQTEITRSRTITRESSRNGGTITRTDSRRDVRRR